MNTNPQKRTVYIPGYFKGRNRFGMIAGPYHTLEQALMVVPAQISTKRKQIRIIRFNQDGTKDHLFVWKNSKSSWERLP